MIANRSNRLREVHRVLGNRLRSAKALGLAPHGSLISRKTVAEVPLAGLTFPAGHVRATVESPAAAGPLTAEALVPVR
jgi:hypothetical protein